MKGKKILIVEDEPRIALALCRALELPVSGTPQVDISPVAETAIAKLQSESFDLVITDLRMPGMGGVELMRHIRDTSPHTRLMLITAYGSPDVEDVTRRLGAAYLPKPFTLRDFVNTVEEILQNAPRNGERGQTG
ncbi:MAG TPA: response regulator [Anaerolineae bacterium]|nr:response regulator [Anaerolineae bacterium]